MFTIPSFVLEISSHAEINSIRSLLELLVRNVLGLKMIRLLAAFQFPIDGEHLTSLNCVAIG